MTNTTKSLTCAGMLALLLMMLSGCAQLAPKPPITEGWRPAVKVNGSPSYCKLFLPQSIKPTDSLQTRRDACIHNSVLASRCEVYRTIQTGCRA